MARFVRACRSGRGLSGQREFASMSRRPRLGQNFLVDHGVAQAIVDLAAVDGAAVIEIGPGRGALTDLLLARAARLDLVEIDAELAGALGKRYAERAKVRVHCVDALTWDWNLEPGPDVEKFKVVSNLPYESGTALVLDLLDRSAIVADATLMLQKEVTARITACSGTKAWGRLGVMVQMYADVAEALHVSPSAFSPRPKVDSQVFQMSLLAGPRFDVGSRAELERILAAAFSGRRKMLRNNLGGYLRGRLGPGQDEEVFAAAAITPTDRPEAVDLAGWARLSREVFLRDPNSGAPKNDA